MEKINYDQFGGIIQGQKDKLKADGANRVKNPKTNYNIIEKLLIKYSKKINYILDKDGKYLSRKEGLPTTISIGPTNFCTAQCVYCPREFVHSKSSGYMDFDLYRNIIDWATRNDVKVIAFSLWGEPTIHPRIIDMIDLAHSNNLNIRISTNAIELDQDKARKILSYPLQAVEISMDGYTRDEYLAGKQVDKYVQAKENILRLLQIAKEKKSKAVFNVHFVDVGNISFANRLKYIRFWKKQLEGLNYITSFSYEPHNWAGTRDNITESMNYFDKLLTKWRLKKPCIFINRININWDGSVYICGNNPRPSARIGNIRDSSIKEIYNSKEREKYLDAHESGELENLDCDLCTVNSILPLAFVKKKIINKIIDISSK